MRNARGQPHRFAALSVMLALSLIIGSLAGDTFGNGLCQSCNAAKKGTPCPAGNACTSFENPCFIGNCNAAAAATGKCVWGPIFSTCWARSCPGGSCVGGADLCECANPGSGC